MDKAKIGIFGTWRGSAFIKAVNLIDEAEITAIYDADPKRIENVRSMCPADVKICDSFEQLLSSGIDAVILCNYFSEHASYAVKAMEAGVDVLSETLPAVTMAQCVELVEAVERTGRIYALAENYPFSRANMEIARVYQSGMLGEVTFAEGEYVHPMSPEEAERYAPNAYHWRRYLPKTYYLTHALAPLMAATNLMPKRVIGKVAAGKGYAIAHGRKDYDGAGIMLVEMDNQSVFRVAGTCHFGGHGNWYRLGCEKGAIESLRGTNDKVRLMMNAWNKDEKTNLLGDECTYAPAMTERGEKALQCGHSGGDYWVTWHFVQDVLARKTPYMNVYRAAALAAAGILGWQSALQDSKQLDIPDFSVPAARAAYANDTRTPFPTADRPADIPHALLWFDKPAGEK